jgi:hypothetical protein
LSATELATAFSATAADNARDDEHTVARSAGRPARCAHVAARDVLARGRRASCAGSTRSGAAACIFEHCAAQHAKGARVQSWRLRRTTTAGCARPRASAATSPSRCPKANIARKVVARNTTGGALSTSYVPHMRCPPPWLHAGAWQTALDDVGHDDDCWNAPYIPTRYPEPCAFRLL